MNVFRAVVSLAAILALSACAADDESFDDQSADGIHHADCAGPYDCRLYNPHSVNSNRYDNPNAADHLWSLEPATTLYDGLGNARGTVASTRIQVNFGQRKNFFGQPHVYAFAVRLEGGTYASGWVSQDRVEHGITAMPTASAHNPHHGDYPNVRTITGGDPAAYGSLKVERNFTGTNGAATDYLVHDGIVNLLYNLPGEGGVSTDTVPLGTRFVRANGVTHVDIPLYDPGSTRVVRTMRFVYGHLVAPAWLGGDRYGWIADGALQ